MAQKPEQGTGSRLRAVLARLSGVAADAAPPGELAGIVPVSDPVEVDRIQGRMWQRLGFFLLIGVVVGAVIGVALRISFGSSGTTIVGLAPQILPWLPGPFAVVLAIHVRMWGAGKDAADANEREVRNLGHARVLYLEALLLGVGLGVLILASALTVLAVLYQFEMVASAQVLTAAALLAALSADIDAEPTKDAQAREEHRAESRLDRLRRAAAYWGGAHPTVRPGLVVTVGHLVALATAAWALGAIVAAGHQLQVGGLPSREEIVLTWLWALGMAVLACGGWYAVCTALVDRVLGPAIVIGIMSAAIWITVIAVPVVGLVAVSAAEPMLTALAVSAAVLPFLLPWRLRPSAVKSRGRSVPARHIGAWASNLVDRSLAAREGRPSPRRRRLRRWYDTISGVRPKDSYRAGVLRNGCRSTASGTASVPQDG